MAAEPEMLQVGEVVKDRWRVIKKLGEGGFGAVFEVFDNEAQESAAMKVESTKEQCQVLKMEVAVLRKLQGRRHVCKFYGCGRNDKFNYVVMGLVGKNLGDYKRDTKDQKFTTSTASRLSFQCLRSMEDIHSVGFLHRDLKPGNFTMGKGKDARLVIMLDFGLARNYINQRGEIRTPRAAAGFRGTVRYASLSAHKNKDMGRVDDLWCLLYMMVEFSAGAVPWRRVNDKDEVGRIKETISPMELLRGCPDEYLQIHEHLSRLHYADRPDYPLMYSVFDKIFRRYRIAEEEPFDWEQGATHIERIRPAPQPRSIGQDWRLDQQQGGGGGGGGGGGPRGGGYRGTPDNQHDFQGHDPFAQDWRPPQGGFRGR